MGSPRINQQVLLMGEPRNSGAPVSGATAWYNPLTIQQTTGVVTAWNDGSGNNFHFGTATNSPVYTASAINGLPGVTFTAASLMKLTGTAVLSNWISASAYTIYAVFKLSAFTGSAGGGYEGTSPVFSDSSGFIGLGGGRSVNQNYGGGHWDGGDRSIYSATSSSGITVIMEQYYDGTNLHVRFNGTDGTPLAVGNVTTLTGHIQSGLNSPTTVYLSGSICEMIFYNTALNSTNRTHNRSYLGTKFAGTG